MTMWSISTPRSAARVGPTAPITAGCEPAIRPRDEGAGLGSSDLHLVIARTARRRSGAPRHTPTMQRLLSRVAGPGDGFGQGMQRRPCAKEAVERSRAALWALIRTPRLPNRVAGPFTGRVPVAATRTKHTHGSP